MSNKRGKGGGKESPGRWVPPQLRGKSSASSRDSHERPRRLGEVARNNHKFPSMQKDKSGRNLTALRPNLSPSKAPNSVHRGSSFSCDKCKGKYGDHPTYKCPLLRNKGSLQKQGEQIRQEFPPLTHVSDGQIVTVGSFPCVVIPERVDNIPEEILRRIERNTLQSTLSAENGTIHGIGLIGRAHLQTKEKYHPRPDAPLVVTGTWTFISSGDSLSIVLRNNGEISKNCGLCKDGIVCTLCCSPHSGHNLEDGTPTVALQFYEAQKEVALIPNTEVKRGFSRLIQETSFNFRIEDYGNALTFAVSDIANDELRCIASADVPQTFGRSGGYISFYNIESAPHHGSKLGWLQNVSITQGEQQLKDHFATLSGSSLSESTNDFMDKWKVSVAGVPGTIFSPNRKKQSLRAMEESSANSVGLEYFLDRPSAGDCEGIYRYKATPSSNQKWDTHVGVHLHMDCHEYMQEKLYRSAKLDYVDYSSRETRTSESISALPNISENFPLAIATAACSRVCRLNDAVALSAILNIEPRVLESLDEGGNCMLGCAVFSRSHDCIIELFHHAHKRDILEQINLPCHVEWRPAHMASSYGLTSALLLILCACPKAAKSLTIGKWSGQNLLQSCFTRWSEARQGDPPISLIALCLEAGVDPNQSLHGRNPLEIAQSNFEKEKIQNAKSKTLKYIHSDIFNLLKRWVNTSSSDKEEQKKEREKMLSKYKSVKLYRENLTKRNIQHLWLTQMHEQRQTSFDLFNESQKTMETDELGDLEQFILCCAISHYVNNERSNVVFWIERYGSILKNIKPGTRAQHELHVALYMSLKQKNMQMLLCLLHCAQENFLPPFDFSMYANHKRPLIFHVTKKIDFLGLCLASRKLFCKSVGSDIQALGIANIKFKSESLERYLQKERKFAAAALLQAADSTFERYLPEHVDAHLYVQKWQSREYEQLILDFTPTPTNAELGNKKAIKQAPSSMNLQNENEFQKYVRNNIDDAKPWMRSKVMLVGDGRAGKTSTLRSLKGQPFRTNEKSTCGADIIETHCVGAGTNVWTQVSDEARDRHAAREMQARKMKEERKHRQISQLNDIKMQSDKVSRRLNQLKKRMERLNDKGDQEGNASGITYSFHEEKLRPDTDKAAPKTKRLENKAAPIIRQSGDESRRLNWQKHKRQERDKRMKRVNQKLLKHASDEAVFHDKNGDEMILGVWDFGGQEVFSAIHHLFFTKYGVYLVVFRMIDFFPGQYGDIEITEEEKTHSLARLRFWLNSILMHAKSCPVFIVGTYKDFIKDEEQHKNISRVLENELKPELFKLRETIEKYTEEIMFFPVDNPKGTDDVAIQKIRERVLQVMLQQKYMKEKFPFRWLMVLDKLASERKEKEFMTLAEVYEIGYDWGIEPHSNCPGRLPKGPEFDWESCDFNWDAIAVTEQEIGIEAKGKNMSPQEIFRKACQMHSESVSKASEMNSTITEKTNWEQIAKRCLFDEVNTMLYKFHQLGMLLYFSDNEKLNQKIILSPQWLMNRFSAVIRKYRKDDEDNIKNTSEPELVYHPLQFDADAKELPFEWQQLKQEGILSKRVLQILWRGYLSSMPYLIELMRENALICPMTLLRSNGVVLQYVVPSLLPSLPQRAEHREQSFSISFPGALPIGLFGRICVFLGEHALRMEFFSDKDSKMPFKLGQIESSFNVENHTKMHLKWKKRNNEIAVAVITNSSDQDKKQQVECQKLKLLRILRAVNKQYYNAKLDFNFHPQFTSKHNENYWIRHSLAIVADTPEPDMPYVTEKGYEQGYYVHWIGSNAASEDSASKLVAAPENVRAASNLVFKQLGESFTDLKAVHGFTVGRRHFGYITWLNPVDLFRLGAIDDIVYIGQEMSSVYEFYENDKYPEVNSGLNCRARVFYENVGPALINPPSTKLGKRERRKQKLYMKRLRHISKSTRYTDTVINVEKRVWSFTVEHFTVDPEVDSEVEAWLFRVGFQVKKKSKCKHFQADVDVIGDCLRKKCNCFELKNIIGPYEPKDYTMDKIATAKPDDLAELQHLFWRCDTCLREALEACGLKGARKGRVQKKLCALKKKYGNNLDTLKTMKWQYQNQDEWFSCQREDLFTKYEEGEIKKDTYLKNDFRTESSKLEDLDYLFGWLEDGEVNDPFYEICQTVDENGDICGRPIEIPLSPCKRAGYAKETVGDWNTIARSESDRSFGSANSNPSSPYLGKSRKNAATTTSSSTHSGSESDSASVTVDRCLTYTKEDNAKETVGNCNTRARSESDRSFGSANSNHSSPCPGKSRKNAATTTRVSTHSDSKSDNTSVAVDRCFQMFKKPTSTHISDQERDLLVCLLGITRMNAAMREKIEDILTQFHNLCKGEYDDWASSVDAQNSSREEKNNKIREIWNNHARKRCWGWSHINGKIARDSARSTLNQINKEKKQNIEKCKQKHKAAINDKGKRVYSEKIRELESKEPKESVLNAASREINDLPADKWASFRLVVSSISIKHFEEDMQKQDAANMLNVCACMLNVCEGPEPRLIEQIQGIRNFIAHYSTGDVPLEQHLSTIEIFLDKLGVPRHLWKDEFEMMRTDPTKCLSLMPGKLQGEEGELLRCVLEAQASQIDSYFESITDKLDVIENNQYSDRKLKKRLFDIDAEKREINALAELAAIRKQREAIKVYDTSCATSSRQSEHTPQIARIGVPGQSISCDNLANIPVSKTLCSGSPFLCPTCRKREYDPSTYESGLVLQCMCGQMLKIID